jgi:hypothetical protein
VLLNCYCAGDKIYNNEMGVACNAYEGGERRVPGFGGETSGVPRGVWGAPPPPEIPKFCQTWAEFLVLWKILP